MSCQFIHEESYARSAAKGKSGGHSVSSVIAEAVRAPGAHPHVESPLPPTLLFGCPVEAVEALATSYAATVKDAKGRALRVDSPVLLAGVVSAPDTMTDADWLVFKSDSVTALFERYGERLRSVIEHTDEAHRHFHYYCVPLSGQRFDTLATGRGAKAAAEKDAKTNCLKKAQQSKLGNDAYKAERREFQNWFFNRVGMRHGLTRVGPGRRRLSRGQWQAEQQQAAALKNALTAGADVIASANANAAEILKRHDLAVSISDAVEKRAQKVLAEEQRLPRLREKAESAGYAAGIERSRAVGEKIGTFVGAVGATAKKWWLRVTSPKQDTIDAAVSAKKLAEETATRARVDTARAKSSEQQLAARYSEIAAKLQLFERQTVKKPENTNSETSKPRL